MFPGVTPEAWLRYFAHHLGGLYAGSMVSTLFWLPNPCFCPRLFKRGSRVFCLFVCLGWRRKWQPSSTLAWRIPWMEEPGRLQPMGSLGVGQDWATSLTLFTFMYLRSKCQPTPVFSPGESQGRRSLVGCCLWGLTRVGHDCSDLAAAAVSLEFRFCPSCLCTQLFLVPYNFFVFCCWRIGVSRF